MGIKDDQSGTTVKVVKLWKVFYSGEMKVLLSPQVSSGDEQAARAFGVTRSLKYTREGVKGTLYEVCKSWQARTGMAYEAWRCSQGGTPH